MADDYTSVLAHEFEARDGSFLLQLRVELRWDKAAFTRLTEAMRACCQAYDEGNVPAAVLEPSREPQMVPRWLADGYYYLSTFVRDWTTHPAWAKQTAPEQEYYDAAYERLHFLAEWFFSGQCPFRDPIVGFVPM